VFHHILLDGLSTDFGVFETILVTTIMKSTLQNYNIDEQIKLIANLADTLSAKLEQDKDQHKEFWHKQLVDIEGVDLKFLKSVVKTIKKFQWKKIIR